MRYERQSTAALMAISSANKPSSGGKDIRPDQQGDKAIKEGKGRGSEDRIPVPFHSYRAAAERRRSISLHDDALLEAWPLLIRCRTVNVARQQASVRVVGRRRPVDIRQAKCAIDTHSHGRPPPSRTAYLYLTDQGIRHDE